MDPEEVEVVDTRVASGIGLSVTAELTDLFLVWFGLLLRVLNIKDGPGE